MWTVYVDIVTTGIVECWLKRRLYDEMRRGIVKKTGVRRET